MTKNINPDPTKEAEYGKPGEKKEKSPTVVVPTVPPQKNVPPPHTKETK